MIGPIAPFNFEPSSLPQDKTSIAFYTSPEFAQNELKFLDILISQSDKAAEREKQEFQDALNGTN